MKLKCSNCNGSCDAQCNVRKEKKRLKNDNSYDRQIVEGVKNNVLVVFLCGRAISLKLILVGRSECHRVGFDAERGDRL